MASSMLPVLAAAGPHPSLGVHAETYGRLIGGWRGEIKNHMAGGPVRAGSIEAHFGWVLEGRAIQDVWITPARPDRAAKPSSGLDWFGATLRVFDPKTEAWRATWFDPVSGYRIDLEGRRQGDDIVQVGTRGGWPIRWTFSDIGPESFRWQGHILNPDGVSWDLEIDIAFRRTAAGE
jgi:hypothetical protein